MNKVSNFTVPEEWQKLVDSNKQYFIDCYPKEGCAAIAGGKLRWLVITVKTVITHVRASDVRVIKVPCISIILTVGVRTVIS